MLLKVLFCKLFINIFTTILDIKEFDEETEKKLKARKEMKKNSSSTTNESSKDKHAMSKSIYEKDIDDLAKFPYEKKKQGVGFS